MRRRPHPFSSKRKRQPLSFLSLLLRPLLSFSFPFLLPPLPRPLEHKVPKSLHLLVAQPRGKSARPLGGAAETVPRHLPSPRVHDLEQLLGAQKAVAAEVGLEEGVARGDDVPSSCVAASAVPGEEQGGVDWRCRQLFGGEGGGGERGGRGEDGSECGGS